MCKNCKVLLRRIKALELLAATYRMQRCPSETLFNKLESSEKAMKKLNLE